MTPSAYYARGYAQGLRSFAAGNPWYPSWYWRGPYAEGYRAGWCDAQNAATRVTS